MYNNGAFGCTREVAFSRCEALRTNRLRSPSSDRKPNSKALCAEYTENVIYDVAASIRHIAWIFLRDAVEDCSSVMSYFC